MRLRFGERARLGAACCAFAAVLLLATRGLRPEAAELPRMVGSALLGLAALETLSALLATDDERAPAIDYALLAWLAVTVALSYLFGLLAAAAIAVFLYRKAWRREGVLASLASAAGAGLLVYLVFVLGLGLRSFMLPGFAQ